MTPDDERHRNDQSHQPNDPVGRKVLDDSTRAIAKARELERRVQIVSHAIATPEEEAVRVIDRALETLGASVGVAMRLTTGGGALELLGAVHLPADLREAYGCLPLDAPLPATHVVRTGEPCYCVSRAQLVRAFPAMREHAERLGLHALAGLPTRYLGELQGCVVFGFPAPRTFNAGEQASLRVLASRYARALRDSRRYFAEHDARTAEAAARRAAEDARTVAEAAARAQGDFVAVVSHELRTPLQAILGYADLLADGAAGELSGQQQEFARRISASSLSLLQIVENLLGFSAAQIGRQRIDAEPFDLRSVASAVVTLAEPLAARKRITLRAEVPAVAMHTDARKLHQILTNLVGNAIKFTEQGEVVLGAAVEERVSDAAASTPVLVRIVVRDTGSGIVAADLPHLFEPFWQGPRAGGMASTGTGLGLSIVRQLARLLGGDVCVDSVPGEGSAFTVTVPVVAPTVDGDGPRPPR